MPSAACALHVGPMHGVEPIFPMWLIASSQQMLPSPSVLIPAGRDALLVCGADRGSPNYTDVCAWTGGVDLRECSEIWQAIGNPGGFPGGFTKTSCHIAMELYGGCGIRYQALSCRFLKVPLQ
jgi:hypothetical protein